MASFFEGCSEDRDSQMKLEIQNATLLPQAGEYKIPLQNALIDYW